MGCGQAVEEIGGLAATAFLGPEVGALVGPALGLGTEGAAALGSGLVGAGVGGIEGGGKGALEGGALGAAGGYLGAGGASDITNGLGITTNGVSDLNPFGGTGTTAGGAPTNAAGGAAAAPSTPTSTAPVSGGGFTAASAAPDLGASQIGTQVGGDISGASTSGSTNLGSVASNAIGATDTTGGLALGQPNTYSGFGSGQANIPGATEAATAAFTPASPAPSSSLLNTAGNAAIKSALPLGAAAYEAIKGPAKLPAQASNLEAGGAATAPLLAMETQAANEANSGQLTPTQQASITQGVHQQQNQLIQQLASQGVTDPTHDSRYISGMQQIAQWAQAQQQGYITQAINEATSAGGAASQNIATVANEQIQNDTAFQNALGEAFGALGGNLGSLIPQKQQAA